MRYEQLKAAAKTITMPEDMKRRMLRNCQTKMVNTGKETTMKTNKYSAFFRKPMVAIAVLAVCLSLSAGAVAASGVLKGHFRDVTDFRGAVVGESYEQATDEVDVSVAVNGHELVVMTAFVDPQMIPYRYTEKLGIHAYQIVDANGKTVKEGAVESVEIVDGKAALRIPLDDMVSGRYTLTITAFVSEKKAEQPMNLNGRWECAFVK